MRRNENLLWVMHMESVSIAQTHSSLSYIVLPEDTNPGGTLHGGRYLTLLDETSYCAAMRFCRKHIVTVRFDGALTRIVPVGHVIKSDAYVIYAGNTSMLIEVKATAENMRTGETFECARCYFTCTAVDESTFKPIAIPTLTAESEEEIAMLALGAEKMEEYRRQRQAQ